MRDCKQCESGGRWQFFPHGQAPFLPEPKNIYIYTLVDVDPDIAYWYEAKKSLIQGHAPKIIDGFNVYWVDDNSVKLIKRIEELHTTLDSKTCGSYPVMLVYGRAIPHGA